MTGKPEPRGRSTYLLLSDFERLEEWCKQVRSVFDGTAPFLVGSVMDRPDFRDVDVRMILSDERYDRDYADPVKVRWMGHAISVWGQRETGLPIDFQVQRRTEANAAYAGLRNPMGVRDWEQVAAIVPGIPDPEPVR